MTTTLRDVLFGRDEAGQETLRSLGPLVRAAAAVLPGVDLAQRLSETFDLPLSDVLLGAWVRHRGIEAARRETRANSDLVRKIIMANHTLTSKHRPTSSM